MCVWSATAGRNAKIMCVWSRRQAAVIPDETHLIMSRAVSTTDLAHPIMDHGILSSP